MGVVARFVLVRIKNRKKSWLYSALDLRMIYCFTIFSLLEWSVTLCTPYIGAKSYSVPRRTRSSFILYGNNHLRLGVGINLNYIVVINYFPISNRCSLYMVITIYWKDRSKEWKKIQVCSLPTKYLAKLNYKFFV